MTDPKPITDAELQELRELETEILASPGPWSFRQDSEGWYWVMDARGECVATVGEHLTWADAKIVTLLRNLVPSLLARIEQQEREIGKLKAELQTAYERGIVALDNKTNEIESLYVAIECLVADEVISSSRARELHGLSIESQRALWKRHPNDLYFDDSEESSR